MNLFLLYVTFISPIVTVDCDRSRHHVIGFVVFTDLVCRVHLNYDVDGSAEFLAEANGKLEVVWISQCLKKNIK